MTQRGNAGYGKLVLDGAVAAESVPWEVRQQGLGGIRVFATVSGSKVKLTHEVDDRIFAADLNVAGDQMVGQVNGRSVRLILARQAPSPQSAPQQSARAAPAQMPVAAEPVPAQPEQGLATVAVAPPEESADKPQSGDQAQPRARNEDFVAVPELKPVYFDFDKSVLRPDAADALTNNTTWLKENADTLVLIEGNCDEARHGRVQPGPRRSTGQVGDGLSRGQRNPEGAPVDRLLRQGRPICTENTEECKNQNRRADFRIKSR